MNYYTSDLHLGHTKLIECGFRKFTTLEQVDKFIIDMINYRCNKNDNLYILGDLSMSHKYEEIKETLSQINCNIFVIQGNHDSPKILNKLKEENIICNWWAFKTIEDKDCIIDGKPLVVALHHHPVVDYHSSRRADCCFHGHSHGLNRRTFPDLHDVGVDCNRFVPLRACEVLGEEFPPELYNYWKVFNELTGLSI